MISNPLTMEKLYIRPLTMVHHIEVAQMLATSDTGLKTSPTEADGSEGLVKGRSTSFDIWDDGFRE